MAAVALTVVAVWATAATVDAATFATAWRATITHPLGLAGAVAAFASAFVLRAVAWRRVLPRLPFGQALAALHVALGGNHVLPLRMGEPLRVVSVVRRTGVGAGPALASTVTLRAADIAAVAILAVAAGVERSWESTLVWLVAAGAAVVGAGGAV